MVQKYGMLVGGFADFINSMHGNTGTRNNTSINSAYSHKTSGAAIALRYMAQSTSPINACYIFMDTFTGTLGNITMECTIYNESSATIPSTTVRATSTACTMPDAADKWIKFTFGTPYTPSIGEVLWFVCYNMAADQTTDYPQIITTTQLAQSNATNSVGTIRRSFNTVTTTNGFTTGSSTVAMTGIVTHADGLAVGTPLTRQNTAYYASNTLKRGILIPALDSPVTVVGFTFDITASMNGIQMFRGNSSPNSSPAYTWNTGTDTNEVTDELIGCKMFDIPVTLVANVPHRFVMTFASNSTVPQVGEIEDYSSYSSVFDSFFQSTVLCCSTIDDGAGGWTDYKGASPGIGLMIGNVIQDRVIIG